MMVVTPCASISVSSAARSVMSPRTRVTRSSSSGSSRAPSGAVVADVVCDHVDLAAHQITDDPRADAPVAPVTRTRVIDARPACGENPFRQTLAHASRLR
jgi:hypothetical protein